MPHPALPSRDLRVISLFLFCHVKYLSALNNSPILARKLYRSLSDRSSVPIQNTSKAFSLILAGLEILIPASAHRRLFALWFCDKFTPPLKGFYWYIHIRAIIIHLHEEVKF